MSMAQRPDRDRLLELLADRAIFPLSPDELRELEDLQRRFPDVDGEGFERAAATLHAAIERETGADLAPMPPALRQRVLADAQRELLSAPAAQPVARIGPAAAPQGAPRPRVGPWLALAAAALALAAGAVAFTGLAIRRASDSTAERLATLSEDITRITSWNRELAARLERAAVAHEALEQIARGAAERDAELRAALDQQFAAIQALRERMDRQVADVRASDDAVGAQLAQLEASVAQVAALVARPPSYEAQRLDLLRNAADIVQVPVQAAGDPAGANARGDVVWSQQAQRGFLRITGLAPNDPNAAQYQAWIFDAVRDDRYPVDCGVFNMPPGATELILPLNAQLTIGTPAMFAVTLERPGGVVVSGRERLVLIAKPGG